MKQAITPCINELKETIVSVSRLPLNEPQDCVKLQEAVLKITGQYISLISLQRLFGFASARFHPSPYNLDILSVFCGYKSWRSFCDEHEGKSMKV